MCCYKDKIFQEILKNNNLVIKTQAIMVSGGFCLSLFHVKTKQHAS